MATSAEALSDEHAKYKQFHDSRFSDQVRQRDKWQQIAFGSLGAAALAIGGCVYLGSLPKTSAQLIQVDKSGATSFLPKSQETVVSNEVWDAAKATAFTIFVKDWRTVTTDPVIRSANWDGAYQWVQKKSKAELDLWRWFSEHNPKVRSQEETVSVQIKLAVPVTPGTYEIQWAETTFKDGHEKTQDWHAVFSYRVAGPSGAVKPLNGMGIFITDISGPDALGEAKEAASQ